MRAARYGAFWQLAENFLFVRFLRTTPIVAGRRSDSKNVSFDRATQESAVTDFFSTIGEYFKVDGLQPQAML